MNKEDIILDFEVVLLDDILKSENIKKGRRLKIKNPKIIGMINRVPFYECDIIIMKNIPLLKIKSIFDVAESLEIEETLKE